MGRTSRIRAVNCLANSVGVTLAGPSTRRYAIQIGPIDTGNGVVTHDVPASAGAAKQAGLPLNSGPPPNCFYFCRDEYGDMVEQPFLWTDESAKAINVTVIEVLE